MVVAGDEQVNSAQAFEKVPALFFLVGTIAFTHRRVRHHDDYLRLFFRAHLVHVLLNKRKK